MQVPMFLVKHHFMKRNDGVIDSERENLYQMLRWRLTTVPVEDLGVWDNSKGMPHEWCVGNLLETACYFLSSTKKISDQIFFSAIQFLLSRPEEPIIVVDGRIERGRENCGRTRWTIDDGCMRAVASVLKGRRQLCCYVGSLGYAKLSTLFIEE